MSSEAAKLLLQRRVARRDFLAWCEMLEYKPATHHKLIISKCQEVTDSEKPRYIILLMPPGSAKSTYTSKLFIPWFLGRRPGNTILACSYSKDLAATFGRAARNLVENNQTILGFTLATDSKAADEWETSTGGCYFCAGVGGGIAGRRADLALLDDFLGNQEDADSPKIRQGHWDWFLNDFWPRLKPNASIIIIANRRHEDDLVGRLLSAENSESPIRPEEWEVIKLPFFAKENDPLGRKEGERLWPEWFNEGMAEKVRKLPSRVKAGLYQQEPRPDDGGYFKLSWLQGYEKQDLPENLRVYAASDHACTDGAGDSTVLLFGGWDGKNLYILPECYWAKEDTGKVVEGMLRYGKKHNPLVWWAEKGHISKSIGPFLRDRMQEERNYLRIEEITPKHDKPTRARSAQGMCEFGQVFFPKFASWWDKAENELLTFPGGKNDDWIDAFAHLCAGIFRMTTPAKPVLEAKEDFNEKVGFGFTLGGIKKKIKLDDRRAALIRADR